MKHVLSTEQKQHLARVGIRRIPRVIHVPPEEYAENYALWKTTLPEAGHEIWHTRALAHSAWKQHSTPKAPSLLFKLLRSRLVEIWFYRLVALLFLVLLILIFARPGHAQFSKINSVNVQQNGAPVTNGFITFPFSFNCTTNVTCTVSSGVLSISASSTASTAWSSLTNGTNSNAGTFAASGNSWDFTGAAIFKLRVGAGLTTSANGDAGYDSTGKIWHIWQNGADKFSIAASNLGSSGQPCLSNADGSCTFADPIVSGPDAPGVASTKNPVQIGAIGADGNVHRVASDNSGNLGVQFPSAQPISAASLPLPAGAATSANQTNGSQQTQIVQGGNTATVTAANALKVDGSAVTQPVSAASLPLPANAAQETGGNLATLAGGVTASVYQANIKQIGGTAVVADPCQANTKSYVSINQTANARLVAGTAAKRIYPCSVNVVTATAQNLALVEGTGTTCGTGTAGVPGFGGNTAATGWNLAANGGLTYGNGAAALGQESTAADDMCLFQSGTGQVSGGLSYVIQ